MTPTRSRLEPTFNIPERKLLTDWLCALYEENHPDYRGSAYLTALTEEGTINDLKEAIRDQIRQIILKTT
jgi:hypothetical protein